MLQADDEDLRKLFSICNLDKVEVYFTNLPSPSIGSDSSTSWSDLPSDRDPIPTADGTVGQ